MEYNYSLNNNGLLIINNLVTVKEAITIDDNVILRVEVDDTLENIIESTVSYVVLDSMDNDDSLPEEYFDYTFLNEIVTNRSMKVYYKIL